MPLPPTLNFARRTSRRAWNIWTRDVEMWLVACGFLQAHPSERRLGSVPAVQCSAHHMAPQPLEERTLRRWIRRLKEANLLAWQGRPAGSQLVKRIMQTRAPDDERTAVQHEAWGLAIKLADLRLQSLIQEKAATKLKAWKAKVTTLSGA